MARLREDWAAPTASEKWRQSRRTPQVLGGPADNGREVFDEVSARRLVPRINLDMKSDGVFFLFHQRHSIIGLKV